MFIESSYENVEENLSAISCYEHCSMFTVTVTLKALRAVSICYKWSRSYCYGTLEYVYAHRLSRVLQALLMLLRLVHSSILCLWYLLVKVIAYLYDFFDVFPMMA
jgi:hypothetical protein